MTKITQEKFDDLVEERLKDFVNNWSISGDEYEELLDEIYGDVQIGNLSYSTGRVLRCVDPIAFSCGMAEEECPEHIQDEKRNEIIAELEEEYEVVD